MNKKLLIAFGIGWFVIMDMLLRTSGQALGAINDLGNTLRGLSPIGNLRAPAYVYYFTVPISILIAVLSFYLISVTLRLWYHVLKLTEVIIKYITLEDVNEQNTRSTINDLFGDLNSEIKGPIFWNTFRIFISVWSLIFVIQIASSLLAAIIGY